MTSRRSFKRRVRARAAKTGESYTAALRSFRAEPTGGTMSEYQLGRVEKPALGFAASIPVDWGEQPPQHGVPQARWQGPVQPGLMLTVNRISPVGASPRQIAEGTASALRAVDYQVLEVTDATVIGQRGAIMRSWIRGRDLAARTGWGDAAESERFNLSHYFVKSDGDVLCFILGAAVEVEDPALFDLLAARFELIERPEAVAARDRYADDAARVIDRATQAAGQQ